MQNNKSKECRACHCRQCRRGGDYKQLMYRNSNRKVRHNSKLALQKLDDLENLDNRQLVGSVYTD